MKKIISWIICAALLLPLFGLAAQAQSSAQLNFVVLGDSIAAGSGAGDQSRAYAWIIAREKGYDLSNFGAGGDISADLLRKVTSDEMIRQGVREADIIAVSIGGNDMLHAEDGLPALVLRGLLGDYSLLEPIHKAFYENFAGIIDEIRALNPDAMLIVQTLYNSAFPLPSLRAAYAAGVGGINDGIYAYLAANKGAFIVADVYSAFEQRSGVVYIDMTHPSPAGHRLIANVIIDVIYGTQTPLPPIGALDCLACAGRPLLALLDWVLVETARLLHRLLGPVWTLVKF